MGGENYYEASTLGVYSLYNVNMGAVSDPHFMQWN